MPNFLSREVLADLIYDATQRGYFVEYIKQFPTEAGASVSCIGSLDANNNPKPCPHPGRHQFPHNDYCFSEEVPKCNLELDHGVHVQAWIQTLKLWTRFRRDSSGVIDPKALWDYGLPSPDTILHQLFGVGWHEEYGWGIRGFCCVSCHKAKGSNLTDVSSQSAIEGAPSNSKRTGFQHRYLNPTPGVALMQEAVDSVDAMLGDVPSFHYELDAINRGETISSQSQFDEDVVLGSQ